VRIAKAEPASESAPQFAPLKMGEADNRPLRYGAVFRASREAKDESTRAARTKQEQA
jgi:hypothetical protein